MSAAWHLRSEISVGGGRPELCMARAEVEVCALHGARAAAGALPARLTPGGGGGGGCCSGTFQNVLMPPSVPPSLVSRAGLPVRFTQRIGSFIDSEIATVILTHWGEEQSRGRKESAAEWRCRVGQ